MWKDACVKLTGSRFIFTTPKVIRRASCMLTMSYNPESSYQMPAKLCGIFAMRPGVAAGR